MFSRLLKDRSHELKKAMNSRLSFIKAGETVTLTFGDCAENHVGMEQIGERSEVGFNLKELLKAQEKFEGKDCETELVDLVQQLPAS